MAVPSNTYQAVDVVGIREDLAQSVFNLDADKTPLLSALGRVKATSTKHEWLTDELASASASNAQIQGDDASNDEVTAATRLDNYTQISRKVAAVSDTNQAVNSAGNVAKLGYVQVNKIRELKRDIEKSVVSNVAKVAPTSTAAGKSAGIQTWIKTNFKSAASTAGTAPTGDGTDTRTAGTTAGAVSFELIGDCIESCFKETGQAPKTAYLHPIQKRKVSDASLPSGTRMVQVMGETLHTAIDVWESDFGPIRFIPDYLLDDDQILGIDPQYMKIAYLRPFKRTPLSKTGDSTRVMVLQEWTLQCSNEKAHWGLYDLKTS